MPQRHLRLIDSATPNVAAAETHDKNNGTVDTYVPAKPDRHGWHAMDHCTQGIDTKEVLWIIDRTASDGGSESHHQNLQVGYGNQRVAYRFAFGVDGRRGRGWFGLDDEIGQGAGCITKSVDALDRAA